MLRVPLVLRLPGRLAAGRRIESIVENVDIAPTLLALLDLEIPESFEGRGLATEITNSQSDNRDEDGARSDRAAVSELGPEIFSLRTARWRYIYNPKRFTSPGDRKTDNGHHRYFRIRTDELFDLQADPRAQHNVAANHPQVVQTLREKLLSRLRQAATVPTSVPTSAPTPVPTPGPAPELDPDTQEELRALGYVGLTSEQ